MAHGGVTSVPSVSFAVRPIEVVTQVNAVWSVGFSMVRVEPALTIRVSPGARWVVSVSRVIRRVPVRRWRISSWVTVWAGALVRGGISARQAASWRLPVRGVA